MIADKEDKAAAAGTGLNFPGVNACDDGIAKIIERNAQRSHTVHLVVLEVQHLVVEAGAKDWRQGGLRTEVEDRCT